jgi:hypothetical protein
VDARGDDPPADGHAREDEHSEGVGQRGHAVAVRQRVDHLHHQDGGQGDGQRRADAQHHRPDRQYPDGP